MYNFRDITQVVEASESVLPSEALNIEGEYIENLIPGYRTLHVAGREPLSPELSTFSTGSRDGSTIISKRYPERILTITYQLISESSEAFREAFNTLGKILNVKDAILIFNDEQDKYFIGTPYTVEEVEPGRNAVVGKFEILCADPCKRSVMEYEATANLDEKTILIDYKGSHRAFPILEAHFYKESEYDEESDTLQTVTGAGDCGYVAFFNEEEKIIQVGNPDEVDGYADTYEKSQTLALQYFDTPESWAAKPASLWQLNNRPWELNKVHQAGALAMKESPHKIKLSKITTAYKSVTILNKAKSSASEPPFYYTITAKPSQRTEKKVKISFAITASLGRSTAYFGKGYTLKGALYFAGKWHEFTFKKSSERWEGTSGHTINLSLWYENLVAASASVGGIKFKAYREDSLGLAGTLNETACYQVNIPTYRTTEEPTYYLAPSNYGAVGVASYGPCIYRSIPLDAAGESGAKDFTFSYAHHICIGSGTNAKKQIGGFTARVLAADDSTIASIHVNKLSHGNKASLYFNALNCSKIYFDEIDVGYKSDYLETKHKNNIKGCVIEKLGNKITFKAANRSYTFGIGGAENITATAIEFQFMQYTNSPPLAYNGIGNICFTKHNCNTFKDIPNKFGSGDVLQIRCESGEIIVNDYLRPELGALGNDWEGFYLKPGLNQIGFAFSDWVKEGYEPQFKVKYREIYL